MYEYEGTVYRVVDGDTYVIDIDLGFYVTVRERVRLRGADVAERFTEKGKEARQSLLGLITGRPCHLDTYKGDFNDKYGRWIADVSVETLEGTVIDLREFVTMRGWVK